MKPGGEACVRMPAEWEPHEATWLAYPHLSSDWPGKLSAVRWAMVEFVRKLQAHETVHLLVRDAPEAKRAASMMRRGGADPDLLEVHLCPTDRSWLRDSGPTFVVRDNTLGAVCWRFNGWGRYSNWQLDARVGQFIARACGAAIVEPAVKGRAIRMEGGAIESNGLGTLMTTEECLLGRGGRARNPGLKRDDLEAVLSETLGATNILWLGHGIAGDDTSAHIDTLARFVGPRAVATIVQHDRRDDNHRPLRDNLARLRGMRNQAGCQLEVVELPMPQRLVFDGDRLPASYANFYIGNGSVLVPTFNDPNDKIAIRALEACFPERAVCGIHCVDVAVGQGALHCLAQQQPKIPRQETPADSRNRR